MAEDPQNQSAVDTAQGEEEIMMMDPNEIEDGSMSAGPQPQGDEVFQPQQQITPEEMEALREQIANNNPEQSSSEEIELVGEDEKREGDEEQLEQEEGEEEEEEFNEAEYLACKNRNQETLQQVEQQMEKMQERMKPKSGPELNREELYHQMMEQVNEIRENEDLQPFWENLYINNIASDYANYLVEDRSFPLRGDPTFVSSQIDQKYPRQKEHVEQIQVRYVFEENYSDEDHMSLQALLGVGEEIGYILKECTKDRMKILNPEYNSMSIGVDYTEYQMIVVIVLTQSIGGVTKIDSSDKGIDVRCSLWSEKPNISNWGALVAQLIYHERLQAGDDPEQYIATQIGANKIEKVTGTNDYICHFEIAELIIDPPKTIKIFFGSSYQSMKKRYSQKHIKNIKLDQYITFPCTEYPVEHLQEEEANRKFLAEQRKLQRLREEEEIRRKNEERKQAARKLNMEDDAEAEEEYNEEELMTEEEEEEMESNMSDSMEDQEVMGAQPKQITNKMIRMELEKAIKEAREECDKFETENLLLQARIVALNKDKKKSNDRTSEFNMSDVKYANTLARVHQIRQELKNTHEKYSKMANDLKLKLDEKITKCNEIKTTFMQLKREVSLKAAFSKTDKGIPIKDITEWEEAEFLRSKQIQKLRLENLNLRTNLLKHEREVKKKEELAEGLHLIDFEQLKIENQSLNEKIEERNEDLHKLKKKNTTTVQILTHTEEKLFHINEQNNKLKEINENLLKVSNNRKDVLKEKKNSCKQQKVELDNLTQNKGIFNNLQLRTDYFNLIERNKILQEKLAGRKSIHKDITSCLADYKKDLKNHPSCYPNQYKLKEAI